jgi:hypothetical protein
MLQYNTITYFTLELFYFQLFGKFIFCFKFPVGWWYQRESNEAISVYFVDIFVVSF